MTIDEIKEKIKDWVSDIGPMNLTVGDCQMWAFDNVVVSGKEVEKGVFRLQTMVSWYMLKATSRTP